MEYSIGMDLGLLSSSTYIWFVTNVHRNFGHKQCQEMEIFTPQLLPTPYWAPGVLYRINNDSCQCMGIVLVAWTTCCAADNASYACTAVSQVTGIASNHSKRKLVDHLHAFSFSLLVFFSLSLDTRFLSLISYAEQPHQHPAISL
jgi:hypothetical protein